MWVIERKGDSDEILHSPLFQQLMIRDEDVAMRVETNEEEKDEPSDLPPLTRIKMALGNKIHHDSDLPEDEIDEIDLDLEVELKPVEFIYRASTILFLSRFFKVKNLKD